MGEDSACGERKENKMPKSINVAYADFKENLVQLVNESRLPMFLVAEALTLVLDKVQQVAQAQLAEERKKESDADDQANTAEES